MTRDQRLRKLVKDTVSDLAIDFLIYDRKEDEELSKDDLAHVLDEAVVTRAEIVKWFDEALGRKWEWPEG